MGPYPHSAPPPKIDTNNRADTDGFEFVEFGHPEPEKQSHEPSTILSSPVATCCDEGDIPTS